MYFYSPSVASWHGQGELFYFYITVEKCLPSVGVKIAS
jgi:hypothetical protein